MFSLHNDELTSNGNVDLPEYSQNTTNPIGGNFPITWQNFLHTNIYSVKACVEKEKAWGSIPVLNLFHIITCYFLASIFI